MQLYAVNINYLETFGINSFRLTQKDIYRKYIYNATNDFYFK